MNLKPNNNHQNGKHYHATQEGAPSSRQKKGDRYHFFKSRRECAPQIHSMRSKCEKKHFYLQVLRLP